MESYKVGKRKKRTTNLGENMSGLLESNTTKKIGGKVLFPRLSGRSTAISNRSIVVKDRNTALRLVDEEKV